MIIKQLLWIYCQIRFTQYLVQFIANTLIPDHDAHVFNPPLWSFNDQSILDTTIDRLFSGFRRWDAIHFLHIARFGYVYENSLAFFPTYPVLFIRPTAYLLKLLFNETNSYLLSGILINFFLGLMNTVLIYKLALKYQLTTSHAYASSFLYIINPATVFFLAPYSETIFLFSQLLGHYCLKSNRILLSSFCFAFGSTIRSNGIISFGFIFYYYLQQMYQQKKLLLPLHAFILCLSSFISTQYYLYKQYCFEKYVTDELKSYGLDNQLAMPLKNHSSIWCSKPIPISYQYVQKIYWNVGFLNYWTWKQIPNFILATPIFILLINFIKTWIDLVKHDIWKGNFKYLFIRKIQSKENTWFLQTDFFPHIIYILFLSSFALFFMHIQVTTRFLFSSGPFLYYVCADRLKQYNFDKRNLRTTFYLFKNERFLFYYCSTYVVIGICLFSNFLPWT